MDHPRTQAEEQEYRFKLFVDIFGEVAGELQKEARAPAFRAPTNLLSYVENQLATSTPFQSATNANYLRDEIQLLLQTDPVLTSSSAVRHRFQALAHGAALVATAPGKKRPGIAAAALPGPLALARAVVDNGTYFRAGLELLVHQVCDAAVQGITAKELERTTRALFFAFLAAGFSVEDVKQFQSWIVSAAVEHNGHVVSSLPLKTQHRPFLNGFGFDRAAYNAALLAEYSAMGIRERLLALQAWHDEPPRRYVVIFRVTGMVGHREFWLNGVHFYPALVGRPKYITCCDPVMRDEELFGEVDRMNVGVNVEARDTSAARLVALEKVSQALDLVRYTFSTDMTLGVDETETAITDARGHYIAGKHSLDRNRDPRFWFNLDYIYQVGMDGLADCEARVLSPIDPVERGQLRTALHAFRRAAEAIVLEDRLLESWVALESILAHGTSVKISAASSEARIGSVLGLLAADDCRWSRALDAYHDVRHIVANQIFNGHENDVKAPLATLEQAGIVGELGNVPLTDILTHVRTIRPFVIRPWLRAKVDDAVRFYDDPATALDQLTTIDRDVRGEVAVIYQIRNQFVHQGMRDTELLSYYAGRALQYAYRLIWRLLQVTAAPTFHGTFQDVDAKVRGLLDDLKNGNTASLLI